MRVFKFNLVSKLYDIATKVIVKTHKKNPTPFKPLEYGILVRCGKIKEKTDGGIILPTAIAETEAMMGTTGVIVDVGAKAFEDFPEKPEVGDMVAFKAYKTTYAVDGGEYRYIEDKDLLSVNLGGSDE